jgi:hypothetical protein
MNIEPNVPNWITYTLFTGVALFAIGLIVDDIYTVVTGLSLGIMATVSATGEKVIQALSTRPKGL